MLTAEKLKEISKKAEEAVAEMPDGDLKTKAFEVFLQHFLASEAPPKSREQVVFSKATGGASKSKGSKKPGTTKSRILLLKDEGLFAIPRSIGEIKTELQAHGWVLPLTSLSGPLQGLVRERELRRLKEAGGKSKGWKYVNP